MQMLNEQVSPFLVFLVEKKHIYSTSLGESDVQNASEGRVCDYECNDIFLTCTFNKVALFLDWGQPFAFKNGDIDTQMESEAR